MTIHPTITEARIIEAVESGDSWGFCAACGDDAYGVKPDARQYECEGCGEKAVYGAEWLLLLTAFGGRSLTT